MNEEPTPNGTRMDALERMMWAMIDHHKAEFTAMRTWQVLAQDRMERLDRKFEAFLQAEEKRGERIDNLVSAIGELLKHLPLR